MLIISSDFLLKKIKYSFHTTFHRVIINNFAKCVELTLRKTIEQKQSITQKK